MNDKIQRSHLERRAVVYLRQSTMKQVHEHRESTTRQYALRQRAIDLGWTSDAVQVVDEDLGHSGTSVVGREGFQRVAEDVAHGRVGTIFALEASRLARCSADWHRLLDLCGLADVLIADENCVFAPRDPNDRLLLGLKGQMSEVEQTWMRLRLQGGKLSKARRGALFVQPPTGYQWDQATERFRLDPDEQVRRVVAMVFERFRLDGSAHAVTQYLARKGIKVPSRRWGAGEIHWVTARYCAIHHILRNPVYAGAYVYGRTEERSALVGGELRRRWITRLPREDWKVCLPDHHPAYIDWEEFMANQEKLHANRTNHASPEQRGASREGAALLQGLVLCGRCGHRMSVAYPGSSGGRLRYVCTTPGRNSGLGTLCWSLAGTRVDDAVAALFLEAAQPPELELSFAVAREAERQSDEIERQWRLRRDRVQYEAKLAERRYKAVDPDNRVVARTLEADWEERLLAVERVEREYDELRRREKLVFTEGDRAQILSLARDLPKVWHAATTSQAQRKNLLRMLVREVTLIPVDVPTRSTRVQVLWETGAVTERVVARPRHHDATPPAAEEPIRAMIAAGVATDVIARELNRRGITTGMGRPWDDAAVWRAKRRLGTKGPPPPTAPPGTSKEGKLSTRGLAAHFNVTPAMVSYWVSQGWIAPASGGGRGIPWRFDLDDATLAGATSAKARGHGPRGRVRNSEQEVS